MYDNSYELSESTKKLKFEKQEVYKDADHTEISTYLITDEGYL